jgi:uncharacterized protein YqjF (DUF2071 family)
MKLSLRVRTLLIATWPTARDAVAHAVHPALEPAEVDGAFRVSLVALRYEGGRVGRIAVPPFSQLNVRTYVSYRGEPAVYFLRAYVTPPGMGAALLGAPYRPARLHFAGRRVDAPGIGLALAYEVGAPSQPGELGRHELGLFEAAGLRSFAIRRGTAEWRAGETSEPTRADILLAHGFRPESEPSLLYAESTSFEADVPPRRVA